MWDQYIATISEAMQASSGSARRALEAQMKDAAAGRQNAIALERLRGETSRYGVDAQREVAIKQLTENARQFDSTHALDMQKFGLNVQQFGLDYAKTATDYLSTPDRYFQGSTFMDAAQRARGGMLQGANYTAQGQPTPKTLGDFAVLQQSGAQGAGGAPQGYTMPGAPAATGQATGAPGQPAGQGAPGGQGAAQGSGAATDGRVQALGSLFKALPPSSDLGVNDRDYAVLRAAHSIISAPGELAPGTIQSWSPGNKSMLSSAASRLGYDPKDWWDNLQRMQPGQGSATGA
jgi:hypothetical protein